MEGGAWLKPWTWTLPSVTSFFKRPEKKSAAEANLKRIVSTAAEKKRKETARAYRTGMEPKGQMQKFCKCIKKVKKTFRNEKGPIGVCVKSVLWTRNRTLRRFSCGKHGHLVTQKRKTPRPS